MSDPFAGLPNAHDEKNACLACGKPLGNGPHKCTVMVGGVAVTADEIAEAIRALEGARSTAIRQVLAGARSPLAEADYWAVIRAARKRHPWMEQLSAKDTFLSELRAADQREADGRLAAARGRLDRRRQFHRVALSHLGYGPVRPRREHRQRGSRSVTLCPGLASALESC
jgi:hypothetical protein